MAERTPEQVLHCLDLLTTDLRISGMGGYARRLRRYRNYVAGMHNLEKLGPRKITKSALSAVERQVLRTIME